MKVRSREWTMLTSSMCMPMARLLAPLGRAGGMLAALVAAFMSWMLWAKQPHLASGMSLALTEVPMALVFLVSGMLLHELMHLAAFAWAGGRDGSITVGLRMGLVPGFSAVMKVKPNQLDHRDWAMVSLAGPLVTGCMAAVLHAVFFDVHWVQIATLMTMISSAFNLLPWKDSDGYHLIQSIKAFKLQKR